jgi:hypothetical protein
VSATATLAVAAAFNLVCTGTLISGELRTMWSKDRKTEPFSTVLRVDLSLHRWCEGDCKSTSPIQRASDTEILFQLEEKPDIGFDHVKLVNRETGAFIDRMRAGGFVMMSTATCEKAAFTGFPQKRF